MLRTSHVVYVVALFIEVAPVKVRADGKIPWMSPSFGFARTFNISVEREHAFAVGNPHAVVHNASTVAELKGELRRVIHGIGELIQKNGGAKSPWVIANARHMKIIKGEVLPVVKNPLSTSDSFAVALDKARRVSQALSLPPAPRQSFSKRLPPQVEADRRKVVAAMQSEAGSRKAGQFILWLHQRNERHAQIFRDFTDTTLSSSQIQFRGLERGVVYAMLHKVAAQFLSFNDGASLSQIGATARSGAQAKNSQYIRERIALDRDRVIQIAETPGFLTQNELRIFRLQYTPRLSASENPRLSESDIAAHLGVKPDTVKKVLQLMRQKLVAALKEEAPRSEEVVVQEAQEPPLLEELDSPSP